MSVLVDYSDSADSSTNSQSASPLPCPLFNTVLSETSNSCETDELVAGEKPNFFGLENSTDNDRFWITTGSDADLLPTLHSIQTNETTDEATSGSVKASMVTVPQLDSPYNSDKMLNSSALSLLYEIPCKLNTNTTIGFYPRLSLQWPILACTIPPSGTHSLSSLNISLHKLPFLDENHHPSMSKADVLPTPAPHGVDHETSPVSCITLHTRFENDATIHLFVGCVSGFVRVWDLAVDKQSHALNASTACGLPFRCMAVQNNPAMNGLLTGGSTGVIGLWDLRASDQARPQQTFAHMGHRYSVSDLLWLADTQFASTSDTVDRNACDPNLSIWDIRFNKPISHQLYQERWGCTRLADHSSGFAVQTHGNAIVEIWSERKHSGTNSNKVQYRLERRWRYEGHDCQAHPLGLAYSTDSVLLASACCGIRDPVIWCAKRGRGRQPGDLFHLPLPSYQSNVMLTDVHWIPHRVTSATRYHKQLIGIQSDGTVRVFHVRQK